MKTADGMATEATPPPAENRLKEVCWPPVTNETEARLACRIGGWTLGVPAAFTAMMVLLQVGYPEEDGGDIYAILGNSIAVIVGVFLAWRVVRCGIVAAILGLCLVAVMVTSAVRGAWYLRGHRDAQ